MLTSKVASRLREQSPLSHNNPSRPPALGPLPPNVRPTEQLLAPTRGTPITSGARPDPPDDPPPEALFTVTRLEDRLLLRAFAPEVDDELTGSDTEGATTAEGATGTGECPVPPANADTGISTPATTITNFIADTPVMTRLFGLCFRRRVNNFS